VFLAECNASASNEYSSRPAAITANHPNRSAKPDDSGFLSSVKGAMSTIRAKMASEANRKTVIPEIRKENRVDTTVYDKLPPRPLLSPPRRYEDHQSYEDDQQNFVSSTGDTDYGNNLYDPYEEQRPNSPDSGRGFSASLAHSKAVRVDHVTTMKKASYTEVTDYGLNPYKRYETQGKVRDDVDIDSLWKRKEGQSFERTGERGDRQLSNHLLSDSTRSVPEKKGYLRLLDHLNERKEYLPVNNVQTEGGHRGVNKNGYSGSLRTPEWEAHTRDVPERKSILGQGPKSDGNAEEWDRPIERISTYTPYTEQGERSTTNQEREIFTQHGDHLQRKLPAPPSAIKGHSLEKRGYEEIDSGMRYSREQPTANNSYGIERRASTWPTQQGEPLPFERPQLTVGRDTTSFSVVFIKAAIVSVSP